ncbi:MAG: polysaccharide biosynthesis C-terminal domain-containing protein, partial [Candidatus Woesearchaeota archaeon]
GKGIYAPLLAYAFVNIILFSIYIPYIYSLFPDFFKNIHFFSYKQFKPIFLYGLLISFTSFGWIIITQTDVIMLTYFTTTYTVGLYAVALPISLLLLFFMRPINIIFSPLVAQYAAEKKEKELAATIIKAYKYAFIFLLPFALCLIAFSEYIIPFLFSQEYIGASPALQILAVGTFFYSFSLFNSIIFNGIGKARLMAWVVVGCSILNIILNFLLIPYYSLIGAAFATSCSYFLIFVFSLFILKKNISLSLPLFSWVGSLLSGFFSIGFIILLKHFIPFNNIIELFICSFVLFLIYILLLFLFRILSFKEVISFNYKSLFE